MMRMPREERLLERVVYLLEGKALHPESDLGVADYSAADGDDRRRFMSVFALSTRFPLIQYSPMLL